MKMKRGDQRRLALAIGRKPSTVCDYLKGRIRPSYETARRLAAETGTHVLFWLDRENYNENGELRQQP
jgi:plasmid maintenance system antidote protein VapI